MSITSESADQLFRRIKNQDAANQVDIDKHLFPDSITKADICEICGESGSGKSDILLHLMTRCLLPSKWVFNDGSQAFVDLSQHSCFPQSNSTDSCQNKIILIDTDGRFSIINLYGMLEMRVKSTIKKQNLHEQIKTSQVENYIRACMKNLFVYRCFTNEQFLTTLAACEHYVKVEQQKQSNHLSLLFIDSINSNFEFVDKLLFNDQFHTEKYALTLIKRMVDRLNMSVIVTRCDYDQIKSYTKWQSIVTKRICLGKRLTDDQLNIVRGN
jgi:DNA-repair protein XRCC2